MLKSIMHSSYWLGVASFVVALVWKASSSLGIWMPRSTAAINYTTFYKGGILFLLVAVATANYAWFGSQKTQG
jgi:hypothetical protein